MALFSSSNIFRYKLTTGGILVDSSASALDLTDHGTTGNANGFQGGTNTAALFDAGTKYLSHASAATYNVTNLTFAAWVYFPTALPGSVGYICRKFGGSGNRSYRFGVDSTGKLYFQKSHNGSTLETLNGTATLSTATWYHVAVRYNNTSKLCEFFINGSADNSATFTNAGIYASTADFLVGGDGSTGSLNGRLDDLYGENVAMSDADFAALYALSEDFPQTVTIDGIIGQASASGYTATVDKQLTITATIGQATASGNDAYISSDLTVDGVIGDATASGYTASVDRQTTVSGIIGQADASGYTAVVNFGVLYWVGGTGNWDPATEDKTNFSFTSGGAGGDGWPSITDNVIFDSNSNIPGGGASYTCNLINASGTYPSPGTSLGYCKNITLGNPSAGTLTFAKQTGRNNLVIGGSATIEAGVSLTGTGEGWLFISSGAETLTTNAVAIPWELLFRGTGGSITLADNLNNTGSAIWFQSGTFYGNGKNITTDTITLKTWYTLDVYPGAALWKCNGFYVLPTTGGSAYNTNVYPPATASDWEVRLEGVNTSGILFDDRRAKAPLGTRSYGVISDNTTGSGYVALLGSFTLDTLRTIRADSVIQDGTILGSGYTRTLTNFDCSGTAGHLNTFRPYSTSVYTFTKSGGGTITGNYMSFSYCTGTPTNTWYVGYNSTNGGNNTNLIFGNLVTITGITGDATASAYTASIDIPVTITGVVGDATSSGYTANLDFQITIPGSLAEAVASGYLANIDQQFDVNGIIGDVTANGYRATILFGRPMGRVMGSNVIRRMR